MPSAVINVRPVPGNTLPHLIRVTRRNTEAVVAALDRQVILYAPRDHELHGYFASAMLVDMHLDLNDPTFMFVEIRNIEMFPTIVPTTNEGEPFERVAQDREGELKWWVYSAGFRGLSDSETNAILAESGSIRHFGVLDGLWETENAEYTLVRQRVRKAWLRMDILSKHGPVCALTGTSHISRSGIHYEVDICHIIPLGHDGPDVVSNLIPLSKTIHWGFYIGWVSMWNEGTIILSPHADAEFRARFGKLKRARFPEDPAYWPAAESIEYHREQIFLAD